MALLDCQWQIRDLVLGPGTPWDVARSTNPFVLNTRADTGGPRSWSHGSWSGAEFADERTVPMRLHGRAPTKDDEGAVQLIQELNAAFAPVGEFARDVELRFVRGDREYLLFGRPRMSQPEIRPRGHVWADCAFVAGNPLIFSGELNTVGPIEPPTVAGGVVLPMALPFTFNARQTGGSVEIVNEGTAEVGLLVRFDGPLTEPQLTLNRQDGLTQIVRWHDVIIPEGQFLLVDTEAHTSFLNGSEAQSRHPGHVDWPKAPSGTSIAQFRAGDQETGTMTINWRHAWW